MSSLIASGCSKQWAKSLMQLSQLRAAIAREYGEPSVEVRLIKRSLFIWFVNSPLNTESHEDRQERAEKTALFASQHYPAITEVADMLVGFIKVETRFVFVPHSSSVDFFRFNAQAQLLPWAPQPSQIGESRARATAVYASQLDQTEVSIALMQLEGDTDNGLALSPHFSVRGDVTGVRRSVAAPRSVSFDFSSYSEKSMFPGEPQIVFLADGKIVFETAAQFSTSKSLEGKFSEFLLLPVPYTAFRRLAAAKSVRLRIGDREYELTEEQVEALREMTAYVRA
jgi:hypothetical protein